MPREELCHGLAVFTMTLHTDMQAFQPKIQNKCILRTLYRTKIPHQLRGTFCDESPFFPELLCIDNAVIAFVRRTEAGILLRISHPVESAAVYNGTAHSSSMTIHIFRSGMGHNIRPPFKRPAVHRCCKSIVNNKGDSVCMCTFREFLYVKNRQGRICNCLPEDHPGIILKCCIQFVF